MRLRPLALGAMLGVCAGSSAMAQEMPAVDGKRQTEIGLRLAVIHDSNVARSNRAIAVARGLTPDDYILRPQATFSIVQPVGRQALYLQGDVGYDFHKENTQLDRRRVNLTGGGTGGFGICRIGLSASYLAAQSELDDLDGTVVKNLQEATSETANANCGRERGFNAVLSGTHQEVTNSALRQRSADHMTDSGTLALGYGNQSLGKASVVFIYSDQAFPDRRNANGGFGDGYVSRSLGANYEKGLGSKLTVGGGVAATQVKRESAPPGIPLKFTSTNYNGFVNYVVSSRLGLSATTSRAVVPSNRAGKLYDISTMTQVLANYKLGTRFILSGGGRRAETNSNADTAVIGPVLTKSRENAVFASVRYRQSERASLLFDVRRVDRKTDIPSFDYSSTRFGLTLDVSF
jgi:hypothetical protein